MTIDNWLVFAILTSALVMFVREKPRVDIVALLVLVACVLSGLVGPREAFLGFSDPAVITVWTVFILSGGVIKTGIAESIGEQMTRLAGNDPRRILIVMMLITASMSAFMNNIGAVAIMLPAVMGICRQLQLPPSKLLIPLSAAALLGGNITLIGTPPNLIAAAAMEQSGVTAFGFFDYTPTGLIVSLVGLIYMVVIGYRLLPERTSGEAITENYQIPDSFLTEATVNANSPLVGQSINRIRFGLENDVAIVYVRRGDEFLPQASDRQVHINDTVLIEGPYEQVQRLGDALNLRMREHPESDTIEQKLEAAGELVEITLSPRSRFRGLTLREIGFRSRFGLSVLAIRHEGEPLVSKVVDVPLRFGDVLLTQGLPKQIDSLKVNPNFIILDNVRQKRGIRRDKAPHALAVLLLTLGAVIFMPREMVSTTMLLGSIVMVMSGALTMNEAYQSIDWKSVFVIAGMLPLGAAMNNTGTAELIADSAIRASGNLGALAVMAVIFIVTACLTSIISNAAATVIVVPIAVNAAYGLSVNPEPFVITAVVAASSAFLLPIGHQANIIIYGLGGYRFADFVKVGFWLTLLLLVVMLLVVPIIWPL